MFLAVNFQVTYMHLRARHCIAFYHKISLLVALVFFPGTTFNVYNPKSLLSQLELAIELQESYPEPITSYIRCLLCIIAY